jgi:hypothetical protein
MANTTMPWSVKSTVSITERPPMELTKLDNVQTNWQARGSRSDADFKGSATARVLSCRIYQRTSHNAGTMDKCTTPAWRGMVT